MTIPLGARSGESKTVEVWVHLVSSPPDTISKSSGATLSFGGTNYRTKAMTIDFDVSSSNGLCTFGDSSAWADYFTLPPDEEPPLPTVSKLFPQAVASGRDKIKVRWTECPQSDDPDITTVKVLLKKIDIDIRVSST